jgi:hypothetical protein
MNSGWVREKNMATFLKSLLALTFISAVLGLNQSAGAAPVTATLTGLTPYTFPTTFLQGFGNITGGTGAIAWQGVGTNPSGLDGPFNTFCIDLIQDIFFGSTYQYDIAPLATAPQPGAFPSGLPATGMGALKAGELGTLFAEEFDNLGTDNNKEAFQLAIWNIIYDTDNSVSTGAGAFYVQSGVDNSVITLANGWIGAAIDPLHQKAFTGTLIALVGQNGAQDQIYASDSGGSNQQTSVPLPQASLGGGALLTLCALARWKRRVPA